MEKVYPSMRYCVDRPEMSGVIVRSEAEDIALGAGWDDPYGLRTEQPKNKGGRPRKVKE